MNQEPLTLYKLIVLYLLNKVSFPLTMAQVSDLILEKEYTSYLTLQQVINELAQAGLITAKTLVNRTHLQITEEGRNTLSYFENRISDAIKTDIGEYLKKNELEMRNESSIFAFRTPIFARTSILCIIIAQTPDLCKQKICEHFAA